MEALPWPVSPERQDVFLTVMRLRISEPVEKRPDAIACAIEAYLAQGGTITHFPPGRGIWKKFCEETTDE